MNELILLIICKDRSKELFLQTWGTIKRLRNSISPRRFMEKLTSAFLVKINSFGSKNPEFPNRSKIRDIPCLLYRSGLFTRSHPCQGCSEMIFPSGTETESKNFSNQLLPKFSIFQFLFFALKLLGFGNSGAKNDIFFDKKTSNVKGILMLKIRKKVRFQVVANQNSCTGFPHL